MAEIFDLPDLFERTFGYRSDAFNPQFSTEMPGRNLRVESGAYGSPYYGEDAFGREYFMPVKVTYSPDGTQNPSGQVKTWHLPYPVISISNRKTIVDTPLTDRRGTVKELINCQDYDITIKGFIVDEGNNFPENDLITLRSIYELNTAITIECPVTDIFLLRPDRSGSDQVVIRELRLPVVAGVKNVRPYELRLTSDEPFNLISIT